RYEPQLLQRPERPVHRRQRDRGMRLRLRNQLVDLLGGPVPARVPQRGGHLEPLHREPTPRLTQLLSRLALAAHRLAFLRIFASVAHRKSVASRLCRVRTHSSPTSRARSAQGRCMVLAPLRLTPALTLPHEGEGTERSR